jgi:hypothetical protein
MMSKAIAAEVNIFNETYFKIILTFNTKTSKRINVKSKELYEILSESGVQNVLTVLREEHLQQFYHVKRRYRIR